MMMLFRPAGMERRKRCVRFSLVTRGFASGREGRSVHGEEEELLLRGERIFGGRWPNKCCYSLALDM